MTHNKSTADRARSNKDGKTKEQISDKSLTATFKNNNTKLQRENDAAIIVIYDEHERDRSQAIIKTTYSQPNKNGVDTEAAQQEKWYRIQHGLATYRERLNTQRQRPQNNTIPKNKCNTTQTKANVECIQTKTINKTRLKYIIEVYQYLKGKLIYGRRIFTHIFGIDRIEPKRNVIKWCSKLLLIC